MRFALEDHGFSVREAADAESALADIVSNPAEVVILDLMLPGMDGFECCRQLRRVSSAPVLIVSARGDSHDVVAGLEAGADDYIRKPYEVSELAARIRVLRRRVRTTVDHAANADAVDVGDELSVGDIVIRADRGEVTVAGAHVHLTKTELRLLYELASHPGRVFTREMLLERVWDYGYFGDNRIVDVHVRRIRSKIEHNISAPQRLVTVRGFGYKMQA
jgi:DNA-binding response OmpR family regulator